MAPKSILKHSKTPFSTLVSTLALLCGSSPQTEKVPLKRVSTSPAATGGPGDRRWGRLFAEADAADVRKTPRQTMVPQ